jgi:hypothetical protein
MRRINNKINFIFCALLLAMYCTNDNTVQVQGGASGTEVSGCVITGTVVDSNNNTLVGSIIRLRPYNYIAGSDSSDSDNVIKRNVYSDIDGKYTIDSVPAGSYTIEMLFSDSLSRTYDCKIDSSDSIYIIPTISLQKMGVISGDSFSYGSISQNSYNACILGLERLAVIDSSGSFEMLVPAGWSRLNFHDINMRIPRIDTLIYIQPGQKIVLSKFRIKDDLNPVNNDTSDIDIVRNILDANDLKYVDVDSVVVMDSFRVVELHLRGMKLKTITQDIGRLTWLKVLDIGNNRINEIPASIGKLIRLRTLLADTNMIWSVSAYLGTLDSLDTLDLKVNGLQTLPETVKYLVYLSYLSVDGNMLCNLGGATVEWLNKYASSWRNTQECQKHY